METKKTHNQIHGKRTPPDSKKSERENQIPTKNHRKVVKQLRKSTPNNGEPSQRRSTTKEQKRGEIDENKRKSGKTQRRLDL